MSLLRVEFLPSGAADFRSLPADIKTRATHAFDVIARDIYAGKPLQGQYAGMRSFPIGEYRIVFRVETTTWVVLILRIGHERDIDR